MEASNCVLGGSYTWAVVRPVSWRTLAALRGKRKNRDLARIALGEKATPKKIVNTANYFSRIFQGRVPNVGIDQLRLLASGMGYHSWTEFFAELERSATSHLHPEKQSDKDRAFVVAEGIADVGPPVSAGGGDNRTTIGRQLLAAGVALSQAGALLATEQSDPALSDPRPAKPARGNRRAGNR